MAFPTVQSARPVYPPPVPVGPVPDPGGATPVEHAFRTQQAVSAAYTRWRAAHPARSPAGGRQGQCRGVRCQRCRAAIARSPQAGEAGRRGRG